MKFRSNARYNEPVESGSIYDGKIGKLNISVHHIYNGKAWYLTCYNLNIQKKSLNSERLMDAINETKVILKKTVDDLQKDVNAFCEEKIEISKY